MALKTKTSAVQIIFAIIAGMIFGFFLMLGLVLIAVMLSAAFKVQKSPIVFVIANCLPVLALIGLLATKAGRELGVWMKTFIVTTLVVCMGSLAICTSLLVSMTRLH